MSKIRNIAHFVDSFNRWLCLFWGMRNRFAALWWGVKIGKDCKFFGKTYFKRYPETEIVIGNNCEFRSNIDATLHSRACSLITLNSPYRAKIEIGDNCGFSGSVIGAFYYIKIGNNVRCGANTFIFDGDFHINDTRVGLPKKVTIEDNVWLGINSIVMKGVTIGANSIIGANSVVTKSIPSNVIAAGNPCRVIKKLDEKSS